MKSGEPDRPHDIVLRSSTLHPQRAVRWAVFLSAVAVIGYLCAAILRPFLDVIAWSSVIAIAFYPVHRRLLGKALSPLLTYFAVLGGLSVFGVRGIVLGPVVFAAAGSWLEVWTGEGEAMAAPAPTPEGAGADA